MKYPNYAENVLPKSHKLSKNEEKKGNENIR